ncbi:deoxyribonuclease [Stieleria sp. TO1_6]|uniref:deoxyribonuclease n=1 Tax=Stieleria tagensis TaxID=2956795 RepID=UPI00209B0A9D|nr:deoxyribonuclease [Stieleria tagensis]MCO8121563.1 deoxyribonuclease [Stieleria tagensis]
MSRIHSVTRWVGPGATAVGLLYGGFMVLSGGWHFSALDDLLSADPVASVIGEPVSLTGREQRPEGVLRIATFNVSQFADKKSSTREHETGVDVLGTIAKIVAQFDLVAVQEIQGVDGVAIQRLVELLRASGRPYTATISDLIGDDELRESYAFVWDPQRVDFIPGSSYVVQDDGEKMHREPMVASFQARLPANSTRRPFRFTLINAHTYPTQMDSESPTDELTVLADVFQSVRQFEYKQHFEDDCILLGDLSATTEQLGQLHLIPGIVSVAGDVPTDIARTTTHDHILIDKTVTSEYTGQMGVIDLQKDFGLSKLQAQAISDHLPLWAEFEAYERPLPSQAQATASGRRTRLIQ